MAHPIRHLAVVSLLFAGLAVTACEEEQQTVGTRGIPGAKPGGGDAKAPASRRPGARAAAQGEQEESEVDPGPPRPPVALDSKSFSRRRDPFESYVQTELVLAEPDSPRAERDVKMGKYAFEDLKLIAIVNSGRGLVPRALFLASDGKSKTIKQGEYFSSAEVLLAAVNRDYVEIEVVDDDLASSLNLQRGERRAIYLRNE